MNDFKNWIKEEEEETINEGFVGKLGRFLKKLAAAGAVPSAIASVGSMANLYLGGDPVQTKMLSILAAGGGGISLLLNKIGDELSKSDDPEHKKMLDELERIKEEYGWGWRGPTPEGIKRRQERAAEAGRMIDVFPDSEQKEKLKKMFNKAYGQRSEP